MFHILMVFWIPFGIVCISYLMVTILIIHTYKTAFTERDRAKLVRGLKRKAFITSGSLVLCYIACWAPYNVLALLKVDYYIYGEWMSILYDLIILNSVINPIVYGALDFKKFRALCCSWKFKRSSSDENSRFSMTQC